MALFIDFNYFTASCRKTLEEMNVCRRHLPRSNLLYQFFVLGKFMQL